MAGPAAGALLGQHGADLGEGEAELLALQDHGEALAVAGIVDAGGSVPAGGQEAAILVEPQGAEGDSELAGEIADRVQFAPSAASPARRRLRIDPWNAPSCLVVGSVLGAHLLW